MKHIASFIVGLIIGTLASLLLLSSRHNKPSAIISDTIRVTDTLLIASPSPREVKRGPMITVCAPVAHTSDTTEVLLSIDTLVYADTAYRAVVSGYHASLDSLQIFRPTTIVTNTRTIAQKHSRWGLGITAGAALTPRGPQPMIGVGITYSIFDF